MKKKTTKRLALAAALVLTAGLLWMANSLVGNPVSHLLAKWGAADYLAEHYPDTDYVVERVNYSFKEPGYYARVESPSSPDSAFTLYLNWGGQVERDDYERRVTDRGNTRYRLDMEYRDRVKQVLEAPDFPYAVPIGYGTLTDALPREELVLDQVYNISELGRKSGDLVVYVDHETVTPELAAEMMLEIRRRMDEAGVGFHTMDFTLQHPLPEEGPRDEVWVRSGVVPCEEIGGDDLAERLGVASAAIRAEYDRLDAEKEREEELAN